VRLLDAPLPQLLAALTSSSPHTHDLRQVSPFAGVLSEAERVQVLDTARRMARPARPPTAGSTRSSTCNSRCARLAKLGGRSVNCPVTVDDVAWDSASADTW
jgi:hypothetical protein